MVLILICCDKFVSDGTYTYMHETVGPFSCLEHFFISDNLQHLILKSAIIDCGENSSDHLPITGTLDLPNMVTQGVSSSLHV